MPCMVSLLSQRNEGSFILLRMVLALNKGYLSFLRWALTWILVVAPVSLLRIVPGSMSVVPAWGSPEIVVLNYLCFDYFAKQDIRYIFC